MLVSRRARTRARLGVVALTCAAALAACTNQQASINRRPHTGTATASVVAGIQQVTVQALPTYRFSPSTIVVHPGSVRVTLQNVGNGVGAPHNLTFLTFGASTPTIANGQSSSVIFTTPAPGTYTFVCTIHEKQGQTGSLVVLPN